MLHNIGYFGPWILFFLIYTQLSSGHFIFFALQVVSFGVNTLLKNALRHPRPAGAMSVNEWDAMDAEQFGMPSAHSQLTTGMFVYTLVSPNIEHLSFFAFILTLTTLRQRYICRKHTFLQLVVGALIGATISIMFEINSFRR